MATARVCLGAFAGAVGVRGDARLKSFTAAPEDVAAYGAVESEDGARRFTLKVLRGDGDMLVVRAPEIESREDAMALKGVRLYVDRARLPAPDEDEFYYEDLVGLSVVTADGAPWGRVAGVYDFGAGDIIEITGVPGRKGAQMLRFTRATFPEVDIAGGRLTVVPPEEDGSETAPEEKAS